MAFVVADRVRESGSASGTGNVFLSGPTDGFASFVSGIGHGNDTFYAILDPATGDYEVGVGEIRSAAETAFSDDHIVRNGDIYTSSNSGSLVEFTANNTLVCICTQPASQAVFINDSAETAVGAVIDLDTDVLTDHATYKEGRIFYDPIHKTLNYYSDISNVQHEIGLEEHHRVYNNTGSTILKGQPLYFSGNYSNEMPTVALADATNVGKYNAQGLAAADIPNNSEGYILTSGLIDGVDTSGLFAGTNFFVGLTPGAVQNQSPTYPNYPMCLGWVVKSDATTGVLLVNQQNHSVNSFRVQSDTHIGGDLIVDGDLTVVGSQTIASSTNVETGAPFLYLNSGDTIGEANTTFTGSGLDDAYFDGHFSGTTSTTYYVKIDGAGGSRDSFSWSKDNFATTEATNVSISTAGNLLDNGISIKFATLTGHTLNDVWSGTAVPTNVDTGIWSNINTGTAEGGVGYTHIGMFYDVTDNKFKFVKEYDPEPTGTINTNDSSYNAGDLVVNNLDAATATFSGNITITGDGTVDGRDIAADGNKLDGIATNANNYSLPVAASSTLGGIQTGYTTDVSNRNYSVSVDASNNAYVNVPWVDNNTTYSVATSTTAGLVKIGYTASGKNYPVQLSSDQMYVNVPWTDTNTTYSAATSGALGLVKIGYAASGKNYPVQLDANSKAFVNVPWTDTDTNTTYSQANSTTLGLIKIGYTASGKNYPVVLNASGQAYVNVPWVDTNTDTNTTYSAGTGLSLSGTTFNANVSSTAQTTGANTVSNTASRTYAVQVDGNDNLVVNVPWSDTNTDTNTTYTAGVGLTLSGTEFKANVSSTAQTTGANSVSSTASRTYAVQVDSSDNLVVNVPWVDTNTDTNTTYTAGTGLTLSGTQFSLSSTANADKVDNLHASSFIRSDANDNVTGNTEWQDGYKAQFGNSADMEIYHDSGNSRNNIESETPELWVGRQSTGGNFKLKLRSPSGAGGNTLEIDANNTGGFQRINGANSNYDLELQKGGTTYLKVTSSGIGVGSGVALSTTNIAVNGYTSGTREYAQYSGYMTGYAFRYGVVGTSTEALKYDNVYGNYSGYLFNRNLYWTGSVWRFTGAISSTGDVTAYYSSDERLKTNLQPIDNALSKVNQLTGYTFNWNDQAQDKDTEKAEVGVIAQDVEAVLPEIVVDRDDGYKAVRYEQLIPLLIEAIKEQQKQIDELKNGTTV